MGVGNDRASEVVSRRVFAAVSIFMERSCGALCHAFGGRGETVSGMRLPARLSAPDPRGLPGDPASLEQLGAFGVKPGIARHPQSFKKLQALN